MSGRFMTVIVSVCIFLGLMMHSGTMAWFTGEKEKPVEVRAAVLGFSLTNSDVDLGKAYPGYAVKEKSITIQNTGNMDMKYSLSFHTENMMERTPSLFNKMMVGIHTTSKTKNVVVKSLSDWNKAPFLGDAPLAQGQSVTIYFDFIFAGSLDQSDFDECKQVQVMIKGNQVEEGRALDSGL